MIKVGNIEKSAFIGNQRVSQAWVGDRLIQPLWGDVIQENASLGEVLYFCSCKNNTSDSEESIHIMRTVTILY